jgi:arginine-tRNA-protein transferase
MAILSSSEIIRRFELCEIFKDATIERRECPYFFDKEAMKKSYIPKAYPLPRQATDLVFSSGMVRFGSQIFSTICPHCRKCLPYRVIVNKFRLTKSLKRVIRKNIKAGTRIEIGPIKYYERIYQIYKNFIKARYGNRFLFSENEFLRIFYTSPFQYTLQTRVYNNNNEIIGCGFLDIGVESLSSFYFFYEPAYSYLSLGTLSIITELNYAKYMKFKYYYLGYLIEGLSSMEYKRRFMPGEIYDPDKGEWITYTAQ